MIASVSPAVGKMITHQLSVKLICRIPAIQCNHRHSEETKRNKQYYPSCFKTDDFNDLTVSERALVAERINGRTFGTWQTSERSAAQA